MKRMSRFGLLFLFMLLQSIISERDCPGSNFGHDCRLSCHCKDNASCDERQGLCPNACADGWSGRACQRKNLAYGASVTMRLSDKNSIEATDEDITTCVRSEPNRTSWLIVDLGATHRIYSMKLVAGGNTSLLNWKIHVSDDNHQDVFWQPPCTVLDFLGNSAEFQCDDYAYGRYVSIFSYMRALDVCEFQIYACSNYTYGETDCEGRCSCFDKDEICHSIYGLCRSGCVAGLTGRGCQQKCVMSYGSNCVHSCGQCFGGKTCDPVTGHCEDGCAPGWRGPTCDLVCQPGSYGFMCSSSCGNCKLGGVCSPETGTCPMGCKAGFYGNTCTLECETGSYGENCRFTCSNCISSMCDKKDGICAKGCNPGWEGVFCNQACIPGKYGINCQQTCGRCENSTCSALDGSCRHHGCSPGFYGDKCLHECPAGKFGYNCRNKCGYCSNGMSCDPRNGSCPQDCSVGWWGADCLEKCPDGMFGLECNSTCGVCKNRESCHHETGVCENGCSEGFSGELCLSSSAKFTDAVSNSILSTLSGTIGSIVVIFLALLLACVIIKWRREYSYQDYNHRVKKKLLPKEQNGVNV